MDAWIKTLHIVFVMAWMACVFYCPRILVHYTEAKKLGQGVERIEIMMKKLFKFSLVIMIPAFALGFHLWVATKAGPWMHMKLTLVLILLGYHFLTYYFFMKLSRGEKGPSSLFFRFYNETSLVLVIPIVALAVMKTPKIF